VERLLTKLRNESHWQIEQLQKLREYRKESVAVSVR